MEEERKSETLSVVKAMAVVQATADADLVRKATAEHRGWTQQGCRGQSLGANELIAWER